MPARGAGCAIAAVTGPHRAPAHWRAFDEAHADSRTSLAQWADRFPAVPEALMPTRDAALSLLWTNTVAPRGNLTRPAVLMSKNWMHAVWSWDNCFVALGLAPGDPSLAWDQFMLFFDRQAPDGMLAVRAPLHLIDGEANGDGADLSRILWVPEGVWIALWFGWSMAVLAACMLATLPALLPVARWLGW